MKIKKLNALAQEGNVLRAKEAAAIFGGQAERTCGCACYYQNAGGSSTNDNAQANFNGGPGGLISPQARGNMSAMWIIKDDNGEINVW